MRISKTLFDNIISALSDSVDEMGGIIAGKEEDILLFQADKGLESCPNIYRPNIAYLNAIIEKWESEGYVFMGVIHSHPCGKNILSRLDMAYADAVKNAMPDLQHILFPIVTKQNGIPTITFYECKNGIEKIEVEIFND